MFGQVHAGHQFKTGDDLVLEVFRRVFLLVEHAVDAVAEAEAFFQRLQMDIGGAGTEGFQNEQGDESDDRGRVVAVLLFLRVHRDILRGADGQIHRGFGHIFENGACVAFHTAVVAAESLLDLAFRGDDGFDLHLQQVADGVDGLNVRRVRDGDTQDTVCEGDRHCFVAEGDISRDERDDFRGHFGGGMVEVIRIHAVLGAKKLHDILLRNEFQVVERVQRGGFLAGGAFLRLL